VTAPRRQLAALVAALAAGAPAAAQAQALINTGASYYLAPVVSLRDMPFRTVVRQRYDYSCGSAALATLLRFHYGRPVDEAQVFRAMYAVGDQAKIRQVGFSLLDMKTYLASEGIEADGYRETMLDLALSQTPAIAVVSVGAYRHFVVIKGVSGGRVLVGDPALGVKSYSLADFATVWSGVVLLARPRERAAAFNRPDEWGSFPRARTDALSDRSLASFTLGLPPIYQITQSRPLP
jgi:predicted double-glycine peptidase